MADGAGPIEAFPGSSIWPFVLGMGAMFTVLTFVFGLWLAPIGGALILQRGHRRHGGEPTRRHRLSRAGGSAPGPG